MCWIGKWLMVYSATVSISGHPCACQKSVIWLRRYFNIIGIYNKISSSVRSEDNTHTKIRKCPSSLRENLTITVTYSGIDLSPSLFSSLASFSLSLSLSHTHTHIHTHRVHTKTLLIHQPHKWTTSYIMQCTSSVVNLKIHSLTDSVGRRSRCMFPSDTMKTVFCIWLVYINAFHGSKWFVCLQH